MTLPPGQELRALLTHDGAVQQYVLDVEADPRAPLLVYHHGTPAAGPVSSALLEGARAHGFRLVELVRPGYGGSTREPERRVADMAARTQALVDHLNTHRFASIGWSGGGPHTLADVALLPDCVGAVCIAGVGPFGEPDLDFLAGMGQDNLDEFGAAGDPVELEAYLLRMADGLGDVDAQGVQQSLASLLPPVDLAYLTDEYAAELAAAISWSVAHGIWGWFDDDLAFTRGWGFDLTGITKPVTLLQGSDDLMVPAAHGAWLAAHMPTARAVLTPGEGHLSVIARHLDAALASLRELL